MSTGNGGPADLSPLSRLAPELAEMLVTVACDIALVIDEDGVITNVACGPSQADDHGANAWVGRRWTDTVTVETRLKVDEFLADVGSSGVSRQRQLTHPSALGVEIPVAYTAVRLGQCGLTLAVGRDLRLVSALQQRLLDAQQSIERDYWQRRKFETRHRLLFGQSEGPLLLIDPVTFAVVDANDAAAALFRLGMEAMIGLSLYATMDQSSQPVLGQLFDSARFAERSRQHHIRLLDRDIDLGVTIEVCDADAGSVLLLRIGSLDDAPVVVASTVARADSLVVKLLESLCDAVVICATTGRIIFANKSFRDLVHADAGDSLDGTALSAWLRTESAPIAALIATIRANGSSGLLRAQLLRGDAAPLEIEVSAALIDDAKAIGFTIHVVHEPLGLDASGSRARQRHFH